MKQRGRIVAFICCLIMLGSIIPTQAAQVENEIVPMYVDAIVTAQTAVISPDNVLTAKAEYTVVDLQTVTSVVIRTYVEKRSLLIIWNRVDIGTTNNEWVDYGSGQNYRATHTAQLPSSGTYRVTSIFEVYNGSVLIDTIEKTETVEC